MNVPNPTGGKMTPLWIVAGFVTFTEVAVTAAVTQTVGLVQGSLTAFVILYALLVFAAFFIVLWYRPFVFYPPSEFPDADPQKYVDAMRGAGSIVEKQSELLARAKQEPENRDAQFELINPLLDDTFRQFIILMQEKGINLPWDDLWGPSYEIATKNSWSSGTMSIHQMTRKLHGTGFVNIEPIGPSVELTPLGKEFAQWLTRKGARADYLNTPFGGWGDRATWDGLGGAFFRNQLEKEQAETQLRQQKAADESEPPTDQSSAS